MSGVMPAVELRERGIYALPDGREFVISTSGDGAGYLLYNLEAWRRHALPDYRTQMNGRILSRGVVTRGRMEDLKDTGRTIDHVQVLRAS
jgi:hypothetical protein